MKFLFTIFYILSVIFASSRDYSRVDKSLTQNETVKDFDGNIYKTVIIGSQTWIVENLKTTKYSNGDPLPNVTNEKEWIKLYSGAYCNYNNTLTISKIYGKLYNWYAVSDKRNLCPVGWHVPSDDEWELLAIYLKGENIAGGKLKEKGTNHWLNSNLDATNESGFTALPSGGRITEVPTAYFGEARFKNFGSNGYFWSSTDFYPHNAFYWSLSNNSIRLWRSTHHKQTGFSVRCVKD